MFGLISYLRNKFGKTWWCNIIHDWGPWDMFLHQEVVDSKSNGVVGFWVAQKKICFRCNKHKFHSVTKSLRDK